MGNNVLKSHGKLSISRLLEAELTNKNGVVTGKITCPVEKCRSKIRVQRRKGSGSFLNSNFVRHLTKRHHFKKNRK